MEITFNEIYKLQKKMGLLIPGFVSWQSDRVNVMEPCYVFFEEQS